MKFLNSPFFFIVCQQKDSNPQATEIENSLRRLTKENRPSSDAAEGNNTTNQRNRRKLYPKDHLTMDEEILVEVPQDDHSPVETMRDTSADLTEPRAQSPEQSQHIAAATSTSAVGQNRLEDEAPAVGSASINTEEVPYEAAAGSVDLEVSVFKQPDARSETSRTSKSPKTSISSNTSKSSKTSKASKSSKTSKTSKTSLTLETSRRHAESETKASNDGGYSSAATANTSSPSSIVPDLVAPAAKPTKSRPKGKRKDPVVTEDVVINEVREARPQRSRGRRCYWMSGVNGDSTEDYLQARLQLMGPLNTKLNQPNKAVGKKSSQSKSSDRHKEKHSEKSNGKRAKSKENAVVAPDEPAKKRKTKESGSESPEVEWLEDLLDLDYGSDPEKMRTGVDLFFLKLENNETAGMYQFEKPFRTECDQGNYSNLIILFFFVFLHSRIRHAPSASI